MSLVSATSVCGLLVAGLLSLRAASATPKDGTWWMTRPPEERVGYLAGFMDCAVNEDGREEFGGPFDTAGPWVTHHYERNRSEMRTPVWRVLLLFTAGRPRPSPTGAEVHEGRHGFFDGEYWRQHSEAHRVGFVTGYLDCWCQRPRKYPLSRAPEWYVAGVSRWLGMNPADPDDVEHPEWAIADGLSSLRDPRPSPRRRP